MYSIFYLLCLLTAVSAYAVDVGVPNNPVEIRNSSQKTVAPFKDYDFQTLIKANWHQAWLTCRYLRKTLVSIRTKDDQVILENAIRANGYEDEVFWTSGTRLSEFPKFSWYSTGEAINFTYWDNGYPSVNNEERCVALKNRSKVGERWITMPCEKRNSYICE